MSVPIGHEATTYPATSREMERQDKFLSPRVIAREVAKALRARGEEVSPAYLRRLTTVFVRHGFTTLADVRRAIDYADPTGETAVRNVMRGGGR